MYLVIDENPNSSTDERVFSESGKIHVILKLKVESPTGTRMWCDVAGVEEGGVFTPAQAVQVEDSGAGNAWLIYGGSWGLRFRPAHPIEEWSLTNPRQWGVPFKVLDISGEDIEFKNV